MPKSNANGSIDIESLTVNLRSMACLMTTGPVAPALDMFGVLGRLVHARDSLGAGTGMPRPFYIVTPYDYHVTMKTVGIADLKAHLSQHLRTVRKGRTLTVLDRDAPVARLVPIEEGPLEIRKATRPPGDLQAGSPLSRSTDSLAVLLADRQRR
jgi:antitoxin (DNA-binding transcriptional repressor) of toxin-antitoxin stability system